MSSGSRYNHESISELLPNDVIFKNYPYLTAIDLIFRK